MRGSLVNSDGSLNMKWLKDNDAWWRTDRFLWWCSFVERNNVPEEANKKRGTLMVLNAIRSLPEEDWGNDDKVDEILKGVMEYYWLNKTKVWDEILGKDAPKEKIEIRDYHREIFDVLYGIEICMRDVGTRNMKF